MKRRGRTSRRGRHRTDRRLRRLGRAARATAEHGDTAMLIIQGLAWFARGTGRAVMHVADALGDLFKLSS